MSDGSGLSRLFLVGQSGLGGERRRRGSERKRGEKKKTGDEEGNVTGGMR